jgi:hypothetical protein
MSTKVFLSYARDDDEAFVWRLYGGLKSAGFDVWFDRVSMPARQLTFYQEIRDAVAECNRLVFVVGPKAVGSEYVSQEWRFAYFAAMKCVNPIVRLGSYDLIPEDLRLIPSEDFRKDAEFDLHLSNLVRQLSERLPSAGDLVGVPELPPHYLDQPGRLKALRDLLLADLHKPVVVMGAAACVGLHGMGGIGKSVLASALAHHPEVRRAFPDGLHWLTLGQEPNVTELQRRLARHLGDTVLFTSVEGGKKKLRDLYATRAALLVLDDVWQRPHAEVFNVLGPRGRPLLTTRDAGLVMALAARENYYQVELPSQGDAEALLAKAAGVTTKFLPPEAYAVVKECGRLPLALTLCGGMVRSGTSWKDLLEALCEHDLEWLADGHPAEEQHGSIWRAMDVSIRALPDEQRDRFAELAVFGRDAGPPEAAVETLWQHTAGLSPRHARGILNNFALRSLVGIEGESRRITLHDLLHNFATGMATRRFGSESTLHGKLLDAYAEKCPNGWLYGPNDGYFFKHLVYHLGRAERALEIRSLLALETPEGRPAWYEAKRAAGDLSGYLSDVRAAWDLENQTTLADPGFPHSFGLQVRYALILATFNATAVSHPLWEALLARQPENAAQWLSDVRRTPEHWIRGHALVRLAPHLTGKGITDALRLAWELDEQQRGATLAGLAPYLPAELLKQACEAVFQIQSDSPRGEALKMLSRLIPDSLLEDAFRSAERIKDEELRAGVIAALATRLAQAGSVTEALARCGVGGEVPFELQASAIEILAPHLSREGVSQAFRLSVASELGEPRSRALSSLVPHLPEDLMPVALTALGSINDTWIGTFAGAVAARLSAPELREAIHQHEKSGKLQGAVLVQLISRFAERGCAEEALSMLPRIESAWCRALALSSVSQHLPARAIPQALEVAHGLPNDPDRPGGREYALIALAQRLGPEEQSPLLDQVLNCLSDLDDEFYRWGDLKWAAPHLTLPQARRALRMAQQATKTDRAEHALVALSARMAELGALDEAEAAARGISGESPRSEALAAVAQHLPASKIEQVLRARGAEQWPESAVAALVPRVPEALLPEVGRIITNPRIDDNYERSNAQLRLLELLAWRGDYAAAIQAVRYVESPDKASSVLATVASDLPEPLLEAAIAFVKGVPRGDRPLAHLLAQLSRYGRAEEALSQIRRIRSNDGRAEGLLLLIESRDVSEAVAREAFSLLQQAYADPKDWASTLERLAPGLPSHLLEAALTAAKGLTDQAVADMCVRLGETGSGEAARIEMESIERDDLRKYAQARMEVLDPAIERRPVRSALRTARTIADARVQAEATMKLVSSVVRSGYAEIVLKASDENLAALQEKINLKWLMTDLLEALPRLKNAQIRADELVLLTPHLPPGLVEPAGRVARSLKDAGARVAYLKVLMALILRVSVLGRNDWAQQLSPILIEAVKEVWKDSVVHLSELSRRIESDTPSARDRIFWEAVRREVPFAMRHYVTETDLAEHLAEYSRLVSERLQYKETGLWRFSIAGHLPFLELIPPADLYAELRNTLEAQAKGARQEFLCDIDLFGPLLYRLGGPDALVEIICATRDVSIWGSGLPAAHASARGAGARACKSGELAPHSPS